MHCITTAPGAGNSNSNSNNPFAAFAANPLISERLFYTLHHKLLFHLRREISLHRIDSDLYKLERIASYCIGDHSTDVGYWKARKLHYSLLLKEHLPLGSVFSAVPKKWRNQPAWANLLNNQADLLPDAERKLARMRDERRGYCGWLISNPRFIEEHDAFFQKWHSYVTKGGLPDPRPVPEGVLDPVSVTATESMIKVVAEPDGTAIQYARDFKDFLIRWRLANLQGLYLPEPLASQYPAVPPSLAPAGAREVGHYIWIPDIASIPDRRDARQMVEDCLSRPSSPEQLKDWIQIVSAANTAKQQIQRYGRIFQLHHFWLSLHRRWGKRLHGKIEKLHYAFGNFLLPDDGLGGTRNAETVRKDLQFISKRRGRNWVANPSALDHF